jgi:hypothetical protein
MKIRQENGAGENRTAGGAKGGQVVVIYDKREEGRRRGEACSGRRGK